jgi:hypothetical protein
MTIVFGYFQYLNYMYLIGTTIPWIIQACFYVVISILLIRSSKTNFGEKERPELLYYIGVINIIILLIRFAIPVYNITSPSDLDLLFEVIYVISFGLFLSLPFLITYGIFIFKYGKVNEQRFGSYLKFSGILWIISGSISTITLSGYIYTILYRFLTVSLVSILNYALSFFGIVGLIAWVLMIIHSIKNNDNNLLIAATLALVAFGASYIYSVFFFPLLI